MITVRHRPSPRSSSAPRSARGFTLVEIMVALLIGLFLTGGLLTLVQTLKQTNGTQNALSQLQDNERMVMTLIADVIQTSGYWPNPTQITATNEFPPQAGLNVGSQTVSFASAGQSVVGAGGYNDATPDQVIVVRYATSGTDHVIDCTGNTEPAGIIISGFSLAPDPVNLNTYDLMCTLANGTTTQLVAGIKNMQIYYGVQTNPGVSNNSVDTYLDGGTVTADNYWGNVLSVMITVTFVNPLYGTLGGQGQTTNAATVPPTISYTRVIDLMNRTGVTT